MSKGTDIGIGLAAAFVTAMIVTCVSADPLAGKNLAEKWCVECHGIRADRLSPNLDAPTFWELAAEPSITEYRFARRCDHRTRQCRTSLSRPIRWTTSSST